MNIHSDGKVGVQYIGCYSRQANPSLAISVGNVTFIFNGFKYGRLPPHRPARHCNPDSRAIDALRAMAAGGFRHLPVVENGRIWGIISRADFKGMEIDRLDAEEHLWECIR